MNFHFLTTHQLKFFKILQIILIGLFAIILIRTAWVCDDAYMTFRTIDNFINGYGLRWNIAERVQAYTNPLWMFLLSGFYVVTHEIYFTSIAVSIVLSVMSIYLLVFKIAKTHFSALLTLIILIFSNAFIDYSTSGLENPLTYLLIALFFRIYLKTDVDTKKTLFLLALLASLATFNRMDNILWMIPTLVLVFWRNRSWKTVGLMFVGFLPFLLWELFSLIYYGFLFPNTAYAKLNTGLPSPVLLQQGFHYLSDSLTRDPITLSTITIAVLLPFVTKQWKLLPLVLGILLSLIYTVKVGGDFMSGRFLTAPFFIAILILSQIAWGLSEKKISPTPPLSKGESIKKWGFHTEAKERLGEIFRLFNMPALGIIFFLFILWLPNPPILSGIEYQNKDFSNGITDERGFYYPSTGLWPIIKASLQMPNHGWALEGQSIWQGQKAVIIRTSPGFLGFYAGPGLHIISPLALSDPFLARLSPQLEHWRIGHFWRNVPQGYLETIKQDQNRIENKKLAEFYAKIRLVTRGELFSVERWSTIGALNLNLFNNHNIIQENPVRKTGIGTSYAASIDLGTGILTLPTITFAETQTYTAKLHQIYPESTFMFELVNFSPVINSHASYYDAKNKRIYLSEVKILGTESRYEVELMVLDSPLTHSSRFVVISIMQK